MNMMKKELPCLEEGSETVIYLDSLRATIKKIPNWKTPGYDALPGLWFKKLTPIYDRLALQLNKCREEACIPKWVTK